MAAQPPTQHTAETHQNCFGYIILISSIPYKCWLFSCEKEGNGTAFNDTTPLCVIKETCSVWSPGRRATAPLARAVAQLVAPRLKDLTGGSSASIARGSISAPQQLKHPTLTVKMQVAYSQQSSARSPRTLVSPLHWFAF